MLYFEICYWKNSLFHSLNSQHKLNCLIFQLKNLTMLNFIERFLAYDKGLFTGLSNEDILHLAHEPALPSNDLVVQFVTFTGSHQLSDIQMKKILLFGVSSRLKLANLSLNNSFIEIFEDVKAIFQTYQLLCYYSQTEKTELKGKTGLIWVLNFRRHKAGQ